MNNLSNIEPKEVFRGFYEINQHPRSSGNEKEVSLPRIETLKFTRMKSLT